MRGPDGSRPGPTPLSVPVEKVASDAGGRDGSPTAGASGLRRAGAAVAAPGPAGDDSPQRPQGTQRERPREERGREGEGEGERGKKSREKDREKKEGGRKRGRERGEKNPSVLSLFLLSLFLFLFSVFPSVSSVVSVVNRLPRLQMPPAPGSPAASATNGHSFKTARHRVIPTRRRSRSCRRSGHGGPAAGRGGPAPAWHGLCLWYGGAPPPVESPTAASFRRRGGVLRPVGRASHDALPDRLPARGTPWPRPLVVAPRRNPGVPSHPGPVLGAAEISKIWSTASGLGVPFLTNRGATP